MGCPHLFRAVYPSCTNKKTNIDVEKQPLIYIYIYIIILDVENQPLIYIYIYDKVASPHLGQQQRHFSWYAGAPAAKVRCDMHKPLWIGSEITRIYIYTYIYTVFVYRYTYYRFDHRLLCRGLHHSLECLVLPGAVAGMASRRGCCWGHCCS